MTEGDFSITELILVILGVLLVIVIVISVVPFFRQNVIDFFGNLLGKESEETEQETGIEAGEVADGEELLPSKTCEDCKDWGRCRESECNKLSILWQPFGYKCVWTNIPGFGKINLCETREISEDSEQETEEETREFSGCDKDKYVDMEIPIGAYFYEDRAESEDVILYYEKTTENSWSYKRGETKAEIEAKDFEGTGVSNSQYMEGKWRICKEDTANKWVLLENGIVDEEEKCTPLDSKEFPDEGDFFFYINKDDGGVIYYEFGNGDENEAWYFLSQHTLNFAFASSRTGDTKVNRAWRDCNVNANIRIVRGFKDEPTVLTNFPQSESFFIEGDYYCEYFVEDPKLYGLDYFFEDWYCRNKGSTKLSDFKGYLSSGSEADEMFNALNIKNEDDFIDYWKAYRKEQIFAQVENL